MGISSPAAANSWCVSTSSRQRPTATRFEGPAAAAERCLGPAGARLHAPHDTLEPGPQLARIERLGYVVVRPYLQPDDAVHHLAGGRDHDDAELIVLAQVARQRQPVFPGQVEVEQHDVGNTARQRSPHLHARARLRDFEAMRRQILDDHVADRGVVVHDEDACARCH